MAVRAPASWSTLTAARFPPGSPSTTTTGKFAGSTSSASAADVRGAITAIPSTIWAVRRSTASPTDRWSIESKLTTLTKYPAARAACSTPYRVEMGPKKVPLRVITPRVIECPVAKVRAALFGRYPSCWMAASTLERVIGLTLGWPFSTRETVWWDTRANLATSVIAGDRGLSLEAREVAAQDGARPRLAVRCCDDGAGSPAAPLRPSTLSSPQFKVFRGQLSLFAPSRNGDWLNNMCTLTVRSRIASREDACPRCW